MKKIYMLSIAWVFVVVSSGHAQTTKYWRGTIDGNWSNASNWSDNGITPSLTPPATGDIAIFDQGAPVVKLDAGGAYQLKSLVVTGNTTVKLFTALASTLTVTGDGSTNYGLRIDAGSRLEDSVSANVPFSFTFDPASRGQINGTWYFAGHASVTGLNGPTFNMPAAGSTNRLDVNGKMIIAHNSYPYTLLPGTNYIFFNDGSEYQHDINGFQWVRATWATNATIRITGITDQAAISNVAAGPTIGNLVIDCPNMSVDGINLGIPNNTTITGNLQILNTNGRRFDVGINTGPVNINYTINKNFEVSGNSNVALGGFASNVLKSWIVQVNGNFIQNGGTFNIRDAVSTSSNAPTELRIKGNFTQNGGTFGASSPAVPAATELYVVELNGTSNQNVSINAGSIDNVGHYVTLRVNNGAGVTLVKPLSVGRIVWAGSKGKITGSTTNTLTINNPAQGSVSGAGATGYLAGKMIRKANQALAYELPVGGTAFRTCHVILSTATTSEYSAEYIEGAHPVTAVTSPLINVSNSGYWNIERLSGSAASVQLTLNGTVSGAQTLNEIVVGHFNTGTNKWESAKGTTGTVQPGNASSGTVVSELLSSFSPFTFGILQGSALPVYLVSFNARKLSASAAKLDWTITTDSDPDRFEILRSEDGINFLQVGTVKAAIAQLSYSYQDDRLPGRTVYYKLRMIDVKGLQTQSRIVTVFNSGEGLTINSMLPTLVTSQAKLNVSAGSRTSIRFAVTDMYGRIVHQQQTALTAGSQDIWLQFGTLAAGAYQITGYLENGQKTNSIRFVKQ